MEKFYALKTFLKMTGERMQALHATPLAISYRNPSNRPCYAITKNA